MKYIFKNGPSDCRFRVGPAIRTQFLRSRRKTVEIAHLMTVRGNAQKP